MTNTSGKFARFSRHIWELFRKKPQPMVGTVEAAACSEPAAESQQLEQQHNQHEAMTNSQLQQDDEECEENFFTKELERNIIVSLAEEERFISECLRCLKVSKEHADKVAAVLVAADYRGQHCHGLHRLPAYVANLRNKSISFRGKPVILKQSIATAWVSGKNCLGPVVGTYCMDLAIQKAKNIGLGFVSVKDSNNFGIAAYYAMLAAKQNFIGLAMSNDSPFMAAFNGLNPVLGANPIACALPTNPHTFVLDMACSTVPMEKFEYSVVNNRPIPSNWILDEFGAPTSNPERAHTLTPFGGYKGFGLAGMVDILCGVLSGANYSTKVRSWCPQNPKERANLGQAFIALDPKAFERYFDERANDFANLLRMAKPVNVLNPVRVPGDIENENMRLVDVAGGIRYDETQINFYNQLGTELGVGLLKPK